MAACRAIISGNPELVSIRVVLHGGVVACGATVVALAGDVDVPRAVHSYGLSIVIAACRPVVAGDPGLGDRVLGWRQLFPLLAALTSCKGNLNFLPSEVRFPWHVRKCVRGGR